MMRAHYQHGTPSSLFPSPIRPWSPVSPADIRLSSDSLCSCVPSLEAPVMCGPSCLLVAGLLCVLTTVAQALQCYSCGPHSDQV